MKRAKLYGGISLAVALASGTAIVLMLLVGVFSSGDARTDASSSAATTDGSDSGFGEGIKVHGDWVIEVRNPDGSVAERRRTGRAGRRRPPDRRPPPSPPGRVSRGRAAPDAPARRRR